MSEAAIRIVLADDHPIVLAGIRALLSEHSDIEVVGQAMTGPAALRLITELRPDIAVLDMSMPQMSGLTVAQRLSDAGVVCKIIALTVHEEPTYLRQLLELGMGGYVLKRSATDDLVRAIRIVSHGGVYFDPIIASQLVDITTRRHEPGLDGPVELSERESEVLKLAALGFSNKAVAVRLELGVKTVETYKARAMEKLGFHSRVDVIRYAADKGWLTES